jgi:hypothetical protein
MGFCISGYSSSLQVSLVLSTMYYLTDLEASNTP